MKTKTIRQVVLFKAGPDVIYDMLMNSQKNSDFTASQSKISQKVGGKFSAYDGYITGTNLELVPNKKIVQSWHASDWPKDANSTTSFLLQKTRDGTKLTFIHAGVPEKQYESIKQGWVDYYWKPMKNFLE